jgi:TetR/AcrR family transcriptional regulator, transcriptional repressor for nem operon
MRRSRADTVKTRETIVGAAAEEFRRQGIAGAGLARLMAEAGLTHGGFYRHFASKDQLVEEACHRAMLSVSDALDRAMSGKPPEKALATLVGNYLSTDHRDRSETGCALAALGSELARADLKTRETATKGFLRFAQLIAQRLKHLSPRKAESEAMAAAATMIGALTIARIATDKRISSSILSSARAHLLGTIRGRRRRRRVAT